MSTIRPFNGSRTQTGARNPVIDLVKLEIQKKGKLPANERYKYIMQKRLETAHSMYGMEIKGKANALTDFKRILKRKIVDNKHKKIFNSSGRGHSKKAEEALKQVAMKKAAKEAKAMRQMVVVQPKAFYNGHISKKGRIYDVANNLIGQVNTKNGKMSTTSGWSLGRYKPGARTNAVIQEAINKYSPYYINLRKMQQMQQGMNVTHEVINLYGHAGSSPLYGNSPVNNQQQSQDISDYYGSNPVGPRQNIGMTAWGAMSNNAWGTFADNAWGTVSDNAWGTASTDVWGGISAGGLWGVKGPKIWGTGDGRNHLKRLAAHVAAFFGLKIRGGNKAVHEMLRRRGRGGSSRSSSVVRRSVSTSARRR